MLEQDYIMRIILQYAAIIRRALFKSSEGKDPAGAAELIEGQVGEATDIDGKTLLSLAPESMASVLHVSGTDPKIAEYIARSLLLEASYLRDANKEDRAALREGQAYSIAQIYGFELTLEKITEEEWEEFFEETSGENHSTEIKKEKNQEENPK